MHGFDAAHVHQRSHFGSRIQAITHAQLFSGSSQALGEAFERTTLYNDPTGRCAALTGGTKGGSNHAFRGQVEISIVQNNHSILTAQFQRAAAQVASTNLCYLSSYLG